MTALPSLDNGVAVMSQWLDDKIGERLAGMTREQLVAELLTMHRTIKVVEEMGEVVGALIGRTGANPRKGFTHTSEDFVDEQLDVVIAMLGSVESEIGNTGDSEHRLRAKLAKVLDRAGLDA